MHFIRRLIKLTLACSVYYSGFLAYRTRREQKNRPEKKFKILTYHLILEDADKKKADTQPGMCVTRNSFSRQMTFLQKRYSPIKLNELVSKLTNDEQLPDRSVAVTFDDGWIDNLTVAFPILERLNLPATIFLPTDMINSGEIPVFIHASLLLGEKDNLINKAVQSFKEMVVEDDLATNQPAFAEAKLDACKNNAFNFMVTFMKLEIPQMEKLFNRMLQLSGIAPDKWYAQRWLINWDEVRQMNCSVIDFGSHGRTHELMTEISLEQVERELIESKQIIEKELGEPVTIFSYPNGNCNEAIKKLVQKCDYSGAVTQTGCVDGGSTLDRYALKRINLNEGATLGPLGNFSKTIFACLLEGFF